MKTASLAGSAVDGRQLSKRSQLPSCDNLCANIFVNTNIYIDEYIRSCDASPVELIEVYQCFCDATRLRIVHLLTRGPLCVCHFQEILGLAQTKISQHLAYLRKRRMVVCTRHGTWMIYSLPTKAPLELRANLKCLQDCAPTDKRFRADLKALEKVRADCGWIDEALEDKRPCACESR